MCLIILPYHRRLIYSYRPRSVFQLQLVANGNFKTDHVRQKLDGDIWLVNGGGMAPNSEEYFTFLATSIERFTVRIKAKVQMPIVDADADHVFNLA